MSIMVGNMETGNRHGTEEAAENIHPDLQSGSRRDKLGLEWVV